MILFPFLYSVSRNTDVMTGVTTSIFDHEDEGHLRLEELENYRVFLWLPKTVLDYISSGCFYVTEKYNYILFTPLLIT